MTAVIRLYLSILLVLSFPTVSVMAVQGDSEQGRAIYVQHCAACHGSDGKGDGVMHFDSPYMDLTSSSIQNKSDFELWRIVHQGESHSSMKGWRWTLSEQEIVLVLAYVRSLLH